MGWWHTLLDVAGDFRRNILGIVDDLIPDPPPEIVAACGQVNDFLASQGWVNEIFPIWALVIGAATVATCIAASVAIRMARILVSVKSGGGGA